MAKEELDTRRFGYFLEFAILILVLTGILYYIGSKLY